MPLSFNELYKGQILSRPKLVCFVILMVSLFFISQISNFRLDASSDTLVLENDADLNFYREIKKKYGSDDFLITTFSPDKNLFNNNTIEHLISLSDLLNNINGIESVISILTVPLINSPAVSADFLQKETPTFLSERTDKDLAKEELINSPLYQNLLISADGKTTALLLYLQKDEIYQNLLLQRDTLRLSIKNKQTPVQQIQSDKQKLKIINLDFTRHANNMQKQQAKLISDVRLVINQFKQYGALHLGGVPMITADSIAFIQHDLMNFGLVVILFIIATLAIAFSRLRWVVLPLFTCVITGGVMIGLLGLLNWPVTVVSSNFISLMLILTLSLTIHLIVRYQEYHWQNPQASQLAIVSTVIRTKFIPCIFTSITTIVAFASLIVSDIRPVIDFGWMMTIGVCLAFLMVFTLFPAMLMLLPPGKPVNQQNLTKSLVLFVANKLIPQKSKILFVYFLIVAFSIVGVTMLTVENRFIDYFKENTEIYQGMALIDQQLGGTTPLDVIIDAPKDYLESLNTTQEIDAELLAELDMDEEELFSINTNQQTKVITGYWFNPMMLKKITTYHHYLESLPQTGKVLSLSSGMVLINQIEPATLTDNFILSVLYSKLPDSVKSVIIDPYISQDGNQIRFSIRVYESDKSLKRSVLLNKIKQDLSNKFDLEPEQIKFSGMLVLYNNMLQSLFQSQIYTLGTVFFCILLMFIVLYRNIKLSLITILPNLIAAGMVLGLMGWLKIPLDIMTITIAAICVGIAVDNSIHYVHRFKTEFSQCGNYKTAMLNSHSSIGRAMYYTSITITLGFSILALSNFIPSIYFGMLTGFSMVVALVANLTLLPLLLVQFKPLADEV